MFLIRSKNDVIHVVFEGKDKNLLLWKEASLLLAFQHILNKIFSQKIQVDCDFYRKRREKRLKEYAQNVAHHVSETGRNEILEMMNPYERRIIHITLADHPDVVTESIGQGESRRVVILPREE